MLHGIMLVGRGVSDDIVMLGSVSVYRCMSLCSVCVCVSSVCMWLMKLLW